VAHQTFWKPVKKEKAKKPYNSLQQRKPKEKKEIPEWKRDILSHHQPRPSKAERGEFDRKIVAELKEEADGQCQSCKCNPDTTTHHVWPRGRGGRGVKTNGLRLCWPCHDRIQTNEEELQYWISVYREKYGDHFWFDERDWEEFDKKQATIKSLEEDRKQRMERINPIVELLSTAAGRTLKAKEVRLLDGMDDNEVVVFTKLMQDVVASSLATENKLPFGYGYFDD